MQDFSATKTDSYNFKKNNNKKNHIYLLLFLSICTDSFFGQFCCCFARKFLGVIELTVSQTVRKTNRDTKQCWPNLLSAEIKLLHVTKTFICSQQESGAFVWIFKPKIKNYFDFICLTCNCISTCPKYSFSIMADREGILHNPRWLGWVLRSLCVSHKYGNKIHINKWLMRAGSGPSYWRPAGVCAAHW